VWATNLKDYFTLAEKEKNDEVLAVAPSERPLFAEPPTLPVKLMRSSTYVSVYTNNVQISSTFYDVRLLFNDVLGVSGSEITIEEKASVIMSVEHARDLHSALSKTLEQYEQKHGTLRPPPTANI
jgi:hypothetical protein